LAFSDEKEQARMSQSPIHPQSLQLQVGIEVFEARTNQFCEV
jgi:hypothetical protein